MRTRKITFKNKSFQLSLGSEQMNMNSVVPKDGSYEPWLTKYLDLASSFYGSDKTAIDIGANVGLITSVLACLQKEGNVIAFEPLSVIYDHLVQNLSKNKLTNVVAEKIIVGEHDNLIKNINASFGGNVGGAYVSDKKVRNISHSEKVETISLDTYLNQKHQNSDIKILKIDVEGWETFVLKGAYKTIEKHQPVVFIELNVQERSLAIESRGEQLFNELNTLFKHLFLIDRLSHSLIRIKSYSDLRGSMLTGHFVEDLVCFNDVAFLDYVKPHCITSKYSCYHGARTSETKNGTGSINSFSHFPDNWCYSHDFFLQVKDTKPTQLKFTFHNTGPHKKNDILVSFGNQSEQITLKREPVSRTYTFDQNTVNSLYVFVEKTFLATEQFNPNDPRTLGVQIDIEEIGENTNVSIESKKDNLVFDLINSFKKTPVKVLWEDSYYGEYNELFDIFYSFCKVGDKFISLHGEMKIETFYKRRLTDSKIAQVYKCEYELTSKGFVKTNKKLIGLGADPRMVSDGKNAYAYIIGYGEAKHPAFLYVEKDDSLHPLRASKDFDWGKNWQPFLKNGQLFVVHELSPFSIYEIDIKTYELKLSSSVDANFQLPAHYSNHSMFRGGSNAFFEGNTLAGLGRASAQPYKHLPFLWSSGDNEAPTFHFLDFFNQISQKGFGILDPTCFFKEGNNIYFGLACSETTWFHSQEFMNLFLVIDLENSYQELPTLEQVLLNYTDTFIQNKPNLKNHIFHCDRLQHDIPFSYEYGKKSTGEKGTLVYGPYVEIDKEMTLEIELSYLTIQSDNHKAGVFDICLSKTLPNGNTDFIVIAQQDLKTTNKEIRTTTLQFDTEHYIGYKVEFRVLVEKGYELNAFHIRTNSISKEDYRQGNESKNNNLLEEFKNSYQKLFKRFK